MANEMCDTVEMLLHEAKAEIFELEPGRTSPDGSAIISIPAIEKIKAATLLPGETRRLRRDGNCQRNDGKSSPERGIL